MAPPARDVSFLGNGQAPVEHFGQPGHPSHPKLLLAEMAGAWRDATKQALVAGGYTVSCASSAPEMLGKLGHDHPFSVVLCDANLFRLPAQELLPLLRAHDAVLPVLFLSQDGSDAKTQAEARMAWADFGNTEGTRVAGGLLELVGQGVHVRQMASAQQTAQLIGGRPPLSLELADIEAHFNQALEGLYMVYQPIVHAENGRVFGLEALVRSNSTVLSHPGLLFDAAEQLGALLILGRKIRDQVAFDVAQLPKEASGPVFVNLHTRDLLDEALYDNDAPLSQHAARVVLEITERHALEEVVDVGRRVAQLRALGYRIAIDDLGAGYAGLTTLAQVEPEVVKLDMALVRDLQKSAIKRKVVTALAELCRDLKILVIAEGIENLAERDILLQIGVDYLQGFYFGRPERQLKLATEAGVWHWPTIGPRPGAPTCTCK